MKLPINPEISNKKSKFKSYNFIRLAVKQMKLFDLKVAPNFLKANINLIISPINLDV